jgi:hypothetical protein
MNKNEENKIKKILKFGKSLVGTKRNESWKTYKIGTNKGPWWISDDKLPSKKEIKQSGTDCGGLANLMRRFSGLSVTETDGTGGWFDYLKKKKRLKKFDYKKSYPIGTLLLRDYNKIDSGHVAIIYEENKKGVLFSKLLHSVGWNDGTGKKGVKIDASVGQSYFFQYNGTTNTGHYTHICLPKNWLLKE